MEALIRKLILLLCIPLFGGNSLYSQIATTAAPLTTITLAECQSWSRANYPQIQQLDLVRKATQFNMSNARKGYLPQINIYGQATYQSEVTEIPINLPEVEIPTIDKDQYKIYGEIYQPLTHFSRVNAQREQAALEGSLEEQNIEVDLYKIKDRVNQIYFSILLLDAKLEQLGLIRLDLDSTMARINAAVENGTATLMDKQLLEVEQINIEQQINETQSNERAFRTMLGMLTGQNIGESTTLNKPNTIASTNVIDRPELTLFRLQGQILDTRQQLLNSQNIPQLGLFLQGGYGRPALNFLSNDLTPYYIGGLKLSWNLSNFYTRKNDRQKLEVQRQILRTQRETFLLNTTLTQTQQSEEIRKYQSLIQSNKQAVQLREQIKETAEVQLINGLITTIDYLKVLNDASRAKEQLKLHELQLLQSQYNLNTTIGN